MPKPSIIAVEDGVTITNPDAATLSRWALIVHNSTCRTCSNPNNDSRCAAGERLESAARNTNDDIPGFYAGI
jgi:hypothetical protein